MTTATESDLRDRVASVEQWYHVLELAPGVVTPGWLDLREVPDKVGMPASLEGKRCLDVGTFDGFWAFEMERRGASEVVAIDILDPERWDWPAGSKAATREAIGRRKAAGRGFEIAREALGSSVERRELSVYDLDPGEVGEFDFVYLGSILLHLKNPIAALEAVRSVCRGQVLSVDAVDVSLGLRFRRRPVLSLDAVGRPWWFQPNVPALRRMLEASGFEPVGKTRRVMLPVGPGGLHGRIALRALLDKRGWRELVRRRVGDPHAATLARAA